MTSHECAGSFAGFGPLGGSIQQAAEGGGVGEAVHEEVEGGEADQCPAQGRDAGNDEDGAGKGDDAEEGVGAQERGWVFGRSFGLKRRNEVAVEPTRKAPARAYGAGRDHQDDERDQPGGGLDPGHDEREAKASGYGKLMEAAFAAIGHERGPVSAVGPGLMGAWGDGGKANCGVACAAAPRDR